MTTKKGTMMNNSKRRGAILGAFLAVAVLLTAPQGVSANNSHPDARPCGDIRSGAFDYSIAEDHSDEVLGVDTADTDDVTGTLSGSLQLADELCQDATLTVVVHRIESVNGEFVSRDESELVFTDSATAFEISTGLAWTVAGEWDEANENLNTTNRAKYHCGAITATTSLGGRVIDRAPDEGKLLVQCDGGGITTLFW